MNTRRPDSAAPLTQARRIVVKVGSALLVDGETGRVNRTWLETLVEDLLRLRKRGQRLILVSSGAIALGRRRLGLKHGALRLEESQAAAAVGQIRLAHAYKELLEGCDVTVAQVLLTLEDSERRHRYLNARATLEALLALGALPVINENDTVATAEIRYGDNDRLAARVAQMAGADCLVLLSDVEGLYSADPNRQPGARFIHEVPQITPEIEAMAGLSASQVGSGGMAAKIVAARIAMAAGCHMCIAAGVHRHPLRRIEEGADCTWFVPRASSGSPARCVPPAPSPSMRERCARCSKAAASCPRASPRRADASTAATPSAFSPLTVPRSPAASSPTPTWMPPASWDAGPRRSPISWAFAAVTR